jgi:hypothetical protein
MHLNLGTSHPDFVYPNDEKQAEWTLLALCFASVICVWIILAAIK